MTRILFGGDSAATGFGTVTKELGAGLLALGHDVRFVSMNEVPADELEEPFIGRTAIVGTPSGWLGMEDQELTRERLKGMFTGGLFEDGWTPEAAIALGDPASLRMSPVLDFLPEGFPAWHYVPIEGVGLPPLWREIWSRIRPVAVSEAGATEIEKVTGTRPPVIYHGVDTETFHPVSAAAPIMLTQKDGTLLVLRSREDCRKALGWPADDVILFRHDRHMPRKNMPAMFRIAATVISRHPRVRLIWHSYSVDQGGDLRELHSHYPPPIALRMNSTGFHDNHVIVDTKALSVMLNAADIYVSTSAEGFGLCIAEALACGIPAVGMDYSSVPEVIGKAGVCVPAAGLIDNIYSHFWAGVREDLYAEAVDRLVRSRKARRDMGALGPIHVGALFSWDRAAEQFEGLIEGRVALAA